VDAAAQKHEPDSGAPVSAPVLGPSADDVPSGQLDAQSGAVGASGDQTQQTAADEREPIDRVWTDTHADAPVEKPEPTADGADQDVEPQVEPTRQISAQQLDEEPAKPVLVAQSHADVPDEEEEEESAAAPRLPLRALLDSEEDDSVPPPRSQAPPVIHWDDEEDDDDAPPPRRPPPAEADDNDNVVMTAARRHKFDDSDDEIPDVGPVRTGARRAVVCSSDDEAPPVQRPTAGRVADDDEDDWPNPFSAGRGSDSDGDSYEAPVRTNTREDEIRANRRREMMLSGSHSG
jgi:hypothetical protein